MSTFIGKKIFTLNPLTAKQSKINESRVQVLHNKQGMQRKEITILSQQTFYLWFPQILGPDSSGPTKFHRKSAELHVNSYKNYAYMFALSVIV